MKYGKIHFINRIDLENAGDRECCPLNYYYEYFKQFNLMRHDIDSIKYYEINIDDIVILGGSGLFNVTKSFNNAINKVLECCHNVIVWSAGFNTHAGRWFQGETFPDIRMERFKMVSIRDYNHPSKIEYLPCPSAIAVGKINRYIDGKKIRKYGVIEHKDLPIQGIDWLKDRIKNSETLDNIVRYIKSSEVIITNTYHCAYWSILLNKKTIVIGKWSTKFDYFKCKPEFISIGQGEILTQKKIEESSKKANIYEGALEEAVKLNDLYFKRVKDYIDKCNLSKCKEKQEIYQMEYINSWNLQSKLEEIDWLLERRLEMEEFHQEVFFKINQLHDELYLAMNQLHDELYERINVLHDELYDKINTSHDELVGITNKLHDELYENKK